jgi:hypothetical protein
MITLKQVMASIPIFFRGYEINIVRVNIRIKTTEFRHVPMGPDGVRHEHVSGQEEQGLPQGVVLPLSMLRGTCAMQTCCMFLLNCSVFHGFRM